VNVATLQRALRMMSSSNHLQSTASVWLNRTDVYSWSQDIILYRFRMFERVWLSLLCGV